LCVRRIVLHVGVCAVLEFFVIYLVGWLGERGGTYEGKDVHVRVCGL
jgi:hypothetical protein